MEIRSIRESHKTSDINSLLLLVANFWTIDCVEDSNVKAGLRSIYYTMGRPQKEKTMSANKPEDQATKQSGSNKDSEKEVRDFDPDGQNTQSNRDQQQGNPGVEQAP
jgi:hypothetical protein